MVQHGIMGTKLPCTGSHEGSGTVVAVGSAVQHFKPGDRVIGGIIYHSCGTCDDCRGPESSTQYCTKAAYCGIKDADGYFADYARIDSRWAAKLPDRVSFETAAPLACAGCTVYKAVVLAGLKKGEWLAIVGSGGGLGHLGVQFAKALGLNVIGVDARDEGLELTRKGGANVVIDVRKGGQAVVQEVRNATQGEGVAATVNVSDANTAAATSCAITRMHGTVIQVAQVCTKLLLSTYQRVALSCVDVPKSIMRRLGTYPLLILRRTLAFLPKSYSDDQQPNNVSIPFPELIFRDIRIRGSLICSAQEANDMLQLVAKHSISVNANAFEGLGQMEKLIDLAESGKMKGKGIVIIDQAQIDAQRKAVV